MKVAAIIPAAGFGTRMGTELPKQFLELDGVPIVVRSVRRVAECPSVTEILIATRPEEVGTLEERFQKEKLEKPFSVVRGGDHRQDSVWNAFQKLTVDTEVVVVHDAVRPFVEVEHVERVIAEARNRGAAILGIPAVDTIKQVSHSGMPEGLALISTTIPRELIVQAQTPQAFRYSLLKEAFERAVADGFYASDEAGLIERLGKEVYVVMGSDRNIKITKPRDLELAKYFLREGETRSSGAQR
jgi:2-C-methyl-D-erythritol 4-phosphate cytidylyltransferase